MAKISPSGTAPAESTGTPVAKVVMVGFMGAGKSRAARIAAEQLDTPALDSDALLEQELDEPIESFFDREGEQAFRRREEALVLELLDRPGGAVVSLGGGAVTSDRVRERLRDHVVVFIDVDPALAWERSRDSGRPLARERESFERLHRERVSLYESVQRAVLPSADERALAAAFRLARENVPATVRMAWARTSSDPGGYPVYVGHGALEAAEALWPVAGRPFLVADEQVERLHGERLRTALPAVAAELTAPGGERNKNLAEAERLLRALARAGMERSDALVAVGGGVIGDLAGLCAAVYQRGVDVVHVPTTLVAQVDSAYGGKTGVDLPEAKNYVGAFHQPAAVVTDPALLETLSAEELRAGFAEVVKTALIAGGGLWERVRALHPIDRALADDPDSVSEVIEGCLRTKLAVVARDERDEGVRAELNLGHTFAHALEAATGYCTYRHGEAVAIGLMIALRLSEAEAGLDAGVREEVKALLGRHGLPASFEGPTADELLARAARDKKRRGGRSNFVLLRAPGAVLTECELDERLVRRTIEEMRGAPGEAPGEEPGEAAGEATHDRQ